MTPTPAARSCSPPPRRDKVRVGQRRHDPLDPGGEQHIGARRCPTGVGAGLQRDHGGRAPGPGTGAPQRLHLGVRAARTPVPALTDPRRTLQEHATDERVRARLTACLLGERERAAHGVLDGGLTGLRHARPSPTGPTDPTGPTRFTAPRPARPEPAGDARAYAEPTWGPSPPRCRRSSAHDETGRRFA